MLFPFLDPNMSSKELENNKESILNQVEDEFKKLIKEHISDLNKRGYLTPENTISFLPKAISAEGYKNIDHYVGNFLLNHFIYTTGALQLLTGDIAWANSWEDYIKRMAILS